MRDADPFAPPETSTQPRKRKKRRIFLWVFLAIQVIFLALVIIQLQGHTGPSHADIVSGCYHGNWQGLFKSQHDCVVHYGSALNGAGETGKGIGAALLVVLWCVVDFLTAVTYGIYRLARRPRS